MWDACWCDICKAMRANMANATVNLVYEEKVVNLCDIYAVSNTRREEKVTILDPGAPMSLAGRPWLEKYLAEFDYKIEDKDSSVCY